MSLHSWPLQQAIFSKLNGASLVDYDGSAISGVFDDVPEQTAYPYVVIGEETATESWATRYKKNNATNIYSVT